MMKWIMAAALCSAGMAAAAAATGERMDSNGQLAVQARAGKVLVTVSVLNRGKQALAVPKVIGEDEELFGPYFEIRDQASGAVLEYIGPKVKRGPFGPADYLQVKPGKSFRHSIDISQAYAFLPGKHDYEIRYAGAYIAGLNSAPAAGGLHLAPAVFSHSAPN